MLYNWEPFYLAPKAAINKYKDTVQARETSDDALLFKESESRYGNLPMICDTTGLEDWYYDYSGM